MSEKKGIWKFINLFDIIVTALVVIAAIVLILVGRTTAAPDETTAGTVTYVMEFTKMINGSENLIKTGDKVIDKVKKYNIGTVDSVEIRDAVEFTENTETGTAGNVTHPEGKDAYVTVTAPCTETDSTITVGGGFAVRIGQQISVQGPGWHGMGFIVDIIR